MQEDVMKLQMIHVKLLYFKVLIEFEVNDLSSEKVLHKYKPMYRYEPF